MRLVDAVARARQAVGIPALAAVRVTSAGVADLVVEGVRRADQPGVVASGDRFHLGSNAKALTALLAALSVERGEIGWGTTAAEVLGVGAPTLRQLLTHSGGLHPYGDDDEIAAVQVPDGTPAEQRAAFARMALAEEPLFAPGTAHEYSNAGYATAAAMVESVSGEPWESALETRIFGPLGIDGRIGWPALHAADAPLGHRLVDGELRPHDLATDPYALPPWLRPAGDVSLSPGDYGIFLADQLAGLRGAGRLGSGDLYRFVHAGDEPDEPEGVAYALGWGVRVAKVGPVSQHTGSADTFYAVVVLQTDADRGLALLANAYGDELEAAVNAIARSFLLGEVQ